MRTDNSHLIRALIYFIFLVLIGIIGYSLLLDIGFIDAVYMTIITISTVGYKEVADMNSTAKIFSIFIIFGGIALVGYTLTNFVELLAGGQFHDAWRLRRMEKKIEDLKDHYIVCGAGETGQNVVAQFELHNASVVVVENREAKVRELRERGYLAIHGEPTQETALKQAQITRAKGLISALTSDSENIFVVLTARYLNKDLYIVSRAIEPHAHEKLTMAGANRTVSPNAIGGRRMATMMTKPSIFSFLDLVTFAGDEILNLEEVTIGQGSELLGLTLREAKIPEKTGLIVMSLKKHDKSDMIFNPGPDELLELSDSMIVIGEAEKIKGLMTMAGDSRSTGK